ncbi:TPA: DNA/RNA non-specific endonuclease [Streptococcus suis]|uniref:DNA/RNA non-specific endonuclease n=1 Tax=Streptococcus suis TaxID=1307 RepID=UPI000CF42F58|nr:DNA/RNA non-specific endonuclease [Streptococcus suis]
MKRRIFRLILGILTVIFFFGNGPVTLANQVDYQGLQLLPFTGQKQLVLGEFDHLRRATFAHIQLQDKDEPKKQREPRIKYNPVGWHNYKLTYNKDGKKAYLFNRGHLIGYQFSGLIDQGENLVPLTAWTNSGHYKGTKDTNIEGMLFYENRLDSWLATHPNYWLDYRVTPIYRGDELVPRQIELQYVGIDQAGNLLEIRLGSEKEIVDAYGITRVVLENYSKNAEIDYLTGTAKPSLVPTETASSSTTASASSQQATNPSTEASQELAPVVYIARNGKADVYWYSKDNMPKNTNWSKVISMSEQEAKDLGKRHTSKEE